MIFFFFHNIVDDFVKPDDLSDEDEESEEAEGKEDSDFVLDVEEDSGSDWEMSKSKGKVRLILN